MQINAEKTKLVTNNTDGISTDIRVNGEKLDCVNTFKYLGAIIIDEESKSEILSRIAQTTAALAKLKTIWKIALSSKIRRMRSLVMSVFLYAYESWTLTTETEKKIHAIEMRCLRKLLGIIYSDHISNEEVRNRTRQAIGPHENPLNTATQIEMVRARNKIFRACQDNPAGHSARREKERQTEKKMEGQHPGMDRHDAGRRHEEG
ncbi:hypothetical protein NP493_131g05005 [Ridgeia piscesae]|uniref:Endonuclease-reverse transcriptase n=1 Tax=Ridgeia piscesae TaxID=27915 RepID=A0AAD9P5E8_RIDPI|nr:hypothetical protein NP493_131g05005 [Ridgeia piscesae]